MHHDSKGLAGSCRITIMICLHAMMRALVIHPKQHVWHSVVSVASAGTFHEYKPAIHCLHEKLQDTHLHAQHAFLLVELPDFAIM